MNFKQQDDLAFMDVQTEGTAAQSSMDNFPPQVIVLASLLVFGESGKNR